MTVLTSHDLRWHLNDCNSVFWPEEGAASVNVANITCFVQAFAAGKLSHTVWARMGYVSDGQAYNSDRFKFRWCPCVALAGRVDRNGPCKSRWLGYFVCGVGEGRAVSGDRFALGPSERKGAMDRVCV